MKIRNNFLAYNKAFIGKAEQQEVLDTLKSGWMTMGPKTKAFEEQFSEYIGVKYALSLNSCTAALHLALLAHHIGHGDEVIIPSFTFAATANMVVNVGAKPVFADIHPDSYNINPKEIEKKLTKKTKAIIPVHYAGQPADLDEVNDIAKKRKLVVIEDAAHAVGSTYKNKKIGLHGNTTCYSFYATKNMTTGEGGMLTTNNAKIADFVAQNRLHGISKHAWNRYAKGGSWKYQVDYPGWKYNMIDIQASLGLHQLKRLDGFIAKRIRLANEYNKTLSDLSQITLPKTSAHRSHPYHLYPIQLNSFDRDTFIEKISDMNIGTSVHFIPVHLMPYYRDNYPVAKTDLQVTEQVFEKIVSLPLYPAMKISDAKYVSRCIKDIVS